MIPALFIAAAILASVLMFALGIYCARRDWKAKQSLLASAIAWDREIREYRRGGKPPACKPAIPPAPPKVHVPSQLEIRLVADAHRAPSPNIAKYPVVSRSGAKKCPVSCNHRADAGSSGLPKASVVIIAIALSFATLSSPAWAQTPDSEPHAGQAAALFDGKILDRLRDSFDRQSNQWGERFDRVDRTEDSQGRIGSRIGNFLDRFDGSFLDRVGNLVWLTFIVLMVAGVCFGLRQIAGVLESFAAVGKAWRKS